MQIQQHYLDEGFQAYPAPAKINLFLHIVGRRADGYHLLQSVFRLIDLQDTIYIRIRDDGEIHRASEHPDVPEAQDLTIRAAHLLKAQANCSLGADIAIEKRIPMGGGLGGGSSDAATVLIALNYLWKLNLSRKALMELGLQLGADVPFFIFGKNAWVEGVGEKIQEIPLPANHYLVLTPKIHVSTAQIFNAKELTRNTFPTTIAAFSEMQDFLHNDLEAVVCQQYPAVKACLDWLNQYSKARMSGSGASVFIAQKTEVEVNNILRTLPKRIANTELFCASSLGLNQHPLYNLTSEQ
ncbi:MAG: 4-diphosphocytidyl-2-C-methylerythritol kinase [Pseudomonadota bacterium]|jgi:4-diphosphocytidyl-2-C-methyl-D-erythritol kinase